MSYTIYEASIVASQHLLTAVEAIITKGEKHADAASFPAKKLAEDMLPFSFQIYSTCKLIEAQALMLKGQTPAPTGGGYNGELSTYAEMHARIKDISALLETVDRDDAIKISDKIVSMDFGRGGPPRELSATSFCVGVGIPNMYFHVSMAYAILRNAGVELGKLDYLGPFFTANIPQQVS